jgi:hypothetical protein
MQRLIKMEPINRREIVKLLGLGAVVGTSAVFLPHAGMAEAKAIDEAINKAAGGRKTALVPTTAPKPNNFTISRRFIGSIFIKRCIYTSSIYLKSYYLNFLYSLQNLQKSCLKKLILFCWKNNFLPYINFIWFLGKFGI